jgi:hypothetical protein
VETFAEDGHLTSWKASWPPALPDEFSSMLAELFSPNPSQLARLTEQLWSMEEMKFAVAKLKQKKCSDDFGLVAELVECVPDEFFPFQ